MEKFIEGYGDDYTITDHGLIYSHKRGRSELMKYWDRNGYSYVALCKNGICKKYKVHRLVAKHFIENPNNYPIINHKDANRKNNCVTNLEWCTHQMNVQHAYKNNLMKVEQRRGINRPCAILNDKKIVEIFDLYKTENYSQRKLSKMYGVSCNTIKNVLLRRTWKHVII